MRILRLLLFVFSLYVLPECSYSREGEVSLNEYISDIYSDDIISQFEKFVRINEEHVKKGNFDKTNYIFVYSPGEELDFNRAIPKEIFEGDDDNWLYESRENLMPLADIYRDRLCSYNNRVHPEDGIKYQHFVIVIDLMSFYTSSYFSTVVTQLEESPKEIYFNNQVVPRDNTVINDIGFYELEGETLLTNLWDKINMSAFDLMADRLITIAYISQDMTQLALAEKPGDITNYSVNIEVEINQQGSMFFEEWQSYTANEPPLHFKGFEIISHYIDSYIGLHYNDLDPLNLGCDQFQLYLYNDLARIYYSSKCNLIDNNAKLEEFIKKGAGFLDYLISAREIAITQGISEEHLDDQNFYLEYWEDYLDELIPLFIASPQEDYQVWLSDHYQENVALGPDDFIIQSFYNNFIDITYDSFEDLKAEVERIINHLKPFSNNGYVNFIQSLTSSSDLGLFTSFHIELSWYSFNDILNILNSGTYSQSEKEEIFDLLRSNQDVVWHKILAFNSLGIPGWGVKGEELVESLSTFVVETQLESPNAGGAISKYRTTQDDYNSVVWDLYSKTYTREDEVVDFLPTLKYEYTTNTITNRNTDIVVNQNDIKFDFDMDVCLEWRKLFSPDPITGNDVLQDSRCSPEGPTNEINIGPDAPIDMFDIVYFIDIPYPPYGDFCNDGLCDKKIGIKPAFYNYTIQHYANVEAAIFTGKVVVSSVSVFGLASKLLKAKTATQFAINGLFVANQVLSVYISLNPNGFHDAITLLVGEEYADEVTLAVTILNTAISYYVSQNSPSAILTETPIEAIKLDQVLELVALPQLVLDAAAAGVPQIMSAGEIKLISSITEDARKHSSAFNALYDSQLHALYGVDYSKFFEPEFAPTRANICYLRYFKGIDIAPIISTFDEAKLIKWNQDIQNDLFKDFIQDSDELDIVDSKIKAWDVLDEFNETLGSDLSILIRLSDDILMNPNLGDFLKSNSELYPTWKGIEFSSYAHNEEFLESLWYVRNIEVAPNIDNSPFRHFINGDVTVIFKHVTDDPELKITLKYPASSFLDPDPSLGGLASNLDWIRVILNDGEYKIPPATSFSGMHSMEKYAGNSFQFAEHMEIINLSPLTKTIFGAEIFLQDGSSVIPITKPAVRILNSSGWNKIKDSTGDLPLFDPSSDLQWKKKGANISTMYPQDASVKEIEEIGVEAFVRRDPITNGTSKWSSTITYRGSNVTFNGFISDVGIIKSSYILQVIN